MIIVTMFNSVVRFITAAREVMNEALELRDAMAKRYPFV